MRTILSSRRHQYVKRVGMLLIVMALVAGMVSCSGGSASPKYDLTISADPAAGGTATDETNGSPYTAGTAASIKAEANTGYEFAGWTAPSGGFADANAEETTFTMPAQDVTVTANFEAVSNHNLLIQDWHDLHAIRDNAGDSYLLMNDLDSTTAGYTELASLTANGGKGWQPIGSIDADTGELVDPFSGTFDGQGYEIRDLFVDRPDEAGVGLFGVIDEGGIIENIGVVNADVAGSLGIGSLAGANFGIITDCYASGVVHGSEGIGGLVGGNFGTVSNSYSSGDVTGGTDSTAMIAMIGGLVGTNEHGIITDCYSISSVTGGADSWQVGGLVGFSEEGTVSNCYATGSVTGIQSIGGLVGYNRFGTVSDSYSTGGVTGNYEVGGLVGLNQEGTVNNSFWDMETSGQATSDGGTGKTSTQMKEFVTFSDWDIITVGAPGERNPQYTWNIVDAETYPFLSWQP